MEEVLETLAKLPGEARRAITTEDWEKLAEAGREVVGGEESVGDAMERLFHRRWEDGQEQGAILRELDEAAYKRTLAAVQGEEQGEEQVLRVRSIGPLVGLKEKEARAVKAVMTHVASWLGEKPMVMRNSRRAEQPGLREAIEEKLLGLGRRRPMEGDRDERWAESRSIRVERVVMEGVWAHRKGMQEEDYERLLTTYPEDDYEKYGARFRQEGLWKTILAGVEDLVGGQFVAPWDRGAEREAGAEESFTEGLAQVVEAYATESKVVAGDRGLSAWESRAALRAMVAAMGRRWVAEYKA